MQERNANWVVCSGTSGIFCNATLCTTHVPIYYLSCKTTFNENQCLAGSCSGSLITVTCFGTKHASKKILCIQ